MNKKHAIRTLLLLATTIAGSNRFSFAIQGPSPSPEASQPSVGSAISNQPDSNQASWHAREGAYFKRNWGVDIVDVRRVSSGEMLAFRYVVLDPVKAQTLNDKKNTAYLIDEKSGKKLMVPQLEKVGALRTSNTPQAGRMYWIVFANTGHFVNVGSRVDVIIGDFKVEGLTVDSK